MPTGYTSDITDTTTLSEFVIRCARAFGATIEMRDEPFDTPIPDEFKPSSYHSEQIKKEQCNLQSLNSMTVGEVKDACDLYNTEALRDWEEAAQERKSLKKQYDRLLKLVQKWNPPTKDHNGIKDFMIQQLTDSIKFDCPIYEKPKSLTPVEWLSQRTESVQWNIDHHKKENKAEKDRAKERTDWIKALRESLKCAT